MDPEQNEQQKEPFAVNRAAAQAEAISENDKLLAGLSYISQILLPAVLPVVLLVTSESSQRPFVRYHAIQSLAVMVLAVIYYLAAILLTVIMGTIAGATLCLLWVLFLVPSGLLLYLGIMAFRGQYVQLYWLIEFLKRNAWL